MRKANLRRKLYSKAQSCLKSIFRKPFLILFFSFFCLVLSLLPLTNLNLPFGLPTLGFKFLKGWELINWWVILPIFLLIFFGIALTLNTNNIVNSIHELINDLRKSSDKSSFRKELQEIASNIDSTNIQIEQIQIENNLLREVNKKSLSQLEKVVEEL